MTVTAALHAFARRHPHGSKHECYKIGRRQGTCENDEESRCTWWVLYAGRIALLRAHRSCLIWRRGLGQKWASTQVRSASEAGQQGSRNVVGGLTRCPCCILCCSNGDAGRTQAAARKLLGAAHEGAQALGFKAQRARIRAVRPHTLGAAVAAGRHVGGQQPTLAKRCEQLVRQSWTKHGATQRCSRHLACHPQTANCTPSECLGLPDPSSVSDVPCKGPTGRSQPCCSVHSPVCHQHRGRINGCC